MTNEEADRAILLTLAHRSLVFADIRERSHIPERQLDRRLQALRRAWYVRHRMGEGWSLVDGKGGTK